LPLWGCSRSAITISRRGCRSTQRFRPIDDAALCRNPFRIFTSLLRLELIETSRCANVRRKFCLTETSSPRCLALLDLYESEAIVEQAQEFVQEALETFRWHRHATVDQETYLALHNEHRLIADVVCFLAAILTT
jgi:uncharacterized glyoxalase superfamily metalloenzyme YdcJ